MKKLLLLFTILMIAMLGTSCLSDDLNGGKNPNQGSFFLSFDIQDGIRSAMRSTVAAEPGESDVQTLHLLFFEANGAQGFVDYIVLENEDVNTSLRMSTPIRVDFTGTSLNPAIAYRLLIVANIGEYVGNVDDWLASFTGTTYRDAENTVLDVNPLIGQGISPENLLMSAAAQKEPSQDLIAATLLRGITRFDVQINPDVSVLGYSLAEASVWNVTTTSAIWNPTRNDYSTHIRRFNGIFVENPTGFKGQLYAFENNVTGSAQNDTKTTCLILGIRDVSDALTYYRVNVNVTDAAQFLQRNHVYNVVITGIRGPGAATEEEAYTGATSLLDVRFNTWNMENMGLVMYDGENIMAVPTNRIAFGDEGESRVYQVFTYSPDPSLRLTISRSELPDGITANLVGNTLTVTATQSNDAKNGYIELAFGNLRSVIEISQVGFYEEFLTLRILGRDEDMKINDVPGFPSTPAPVSMTDRVQVNASGDWIARIHNPGFTFVSGDATATSLNGSPGETFTIATTGINTEPLPNRAFIIVMLADNPDISQVLVLSQAGAGRVDLTPEGQAAVNFDPEMVPLNNNVFNANSYGLPITVQVVGTHAGFFRADVTPGAAGTNDITVIANGINMSGNTYEATLRMFITGQLITEKLIPIRQVSHSLAITTPTTTVPVVGGVSQNMIVTSSAPWTATVTTISGTSTGTPAQGGGRRLVRHEATLEDQYGNAIVPGTPYDDNTQLRVRFPKVYYPNRNIQISATVTVSVGGLLQRTATVTQAPLTGNPVVSMNFRGPGDTWGMLGRTAGWYNQGFTWAMEQIPATFNTAGNASGSMTNAAGAAGPVTIPAGVNYLNVVANGGGGAAFNWQSVNNFIAADRGFVAIHAQSASSAGTSLINGALSPFIRAGYNPVQYGISTPTATVSSVSSTTKIHQFFMERGNTSLTTGTTITFTGPDGVRTSTPPPFPSSAAVIMTVGTSNQAIVVFDIPNGFWYYGEGQIWGNTVTQASPGGANQQAHLDNMMYFIGNAARFGTHFTDLFLETGQKGVPVHSAPQPAPWEDDWNATSTGGTDNRGVPTKN